MRSTIMDHTVGTLAGFIVEPIDVLTTGIRIPMEDIILTPMGDIIVRPISGDGVISSAIVGTRQARDLSGTGVRL